MVIISPVFEHILKEEFEFLKDVYIECGDGWFSILWGMCRELQELKIPDIEVLQTKEKYGSLRVYTNSADDLVEIVIDKYSLMSLELCEQCGVEGKLRGASYYKVLCDDCNNITI